MKGGWGGRAVKKDNELKQVLKLSGKGAISELAGRGESRGLQE